MSIVKLKKPGEFVPVSVPCYDWKEESGERVKKKVMIAPVQIFGWCCSARDSSQNSCEVVL
jgi:hypothetical protein